MNFYSGIKVHSIIFLKIVQQMRSSQERIFLEEQRQFSLAQPEIQLLDEKDNQMQYLSQFINSSGSDNLQSIQNIKQQKQVEQLCTQNSITNDKRLQKQQKRQNSQKSKKRQKSYFHNFQKHLVITLRNVIKLKRSTNKTEVQQIASEMWSVFDKSALYSKKFLYVLFGVFGETDQNQFSKKFLNQLGYMEIFAKYAEDKIKQAQKYLRREIIKQFQELNLKGYLMYRKLKRVEQFQKYIQEFLQQLKQGSIRKRLPKQRKANMVLLQKQNLTSPEIVS